MVEFSSTVLPAPSKHIHNNL